MVQQQAEEATQNTGHCFYCKSRDPQTYREAQKSMRRDIKEAQHRRMYPYSCIGIRSGPLYAELTRGKQLARTESWFLLVLYDFQPTNISPLTDAQAQGPLIPWALGPVRGRPIWIVILWVPVSLFLGFIVSQTWSVQVSWENWNTRLRNQGNEFEKPSSQPHIIFILVDDQGFRDVGYHGSEIKTPTLDRLAAQGVKLENYYVQPLCSPSRSQLMTGRYQIHTGLQHSIIRATQPNCLPLENVTLPQKLKQAGYSTHMIGKWHLGFYKRGCLPTQRGFDTFFGSLLGSGDYYSHYKCEAPGICGYDLYEGEEAAWEQDRGLYSTVMFTRKAIRILARHNPRKQPLFLYLAYQAVHSPLQVPARYLERYKGIPNLHRRKYAAMVSCLDEAIHNLTLALKRYGYYDNTVIVYSSDNGGQPFAGGSNWPLRGSKATYWEGGIRAVGFVHSPLLVNKGTKCHSLVHITDWFPTLITLGEGTLDEDLNLDGYDVWEAISEGHPSPRQDILHNIDPIYIKAKNGSWKAGYGLWNTAIQAAIRVGHWKLLTGVPGYSDWVPPQTFSNQRLTNRWHNERVHWDRGKSVWLFNITADPYERVDLSQRYPHIVKKMLVRLVQYNKTAVPVRYPSKDLRSNPQYNGGVWGPWYKDEREEQEEDERYNNLFTNYLGKRRWKKKSKSRKLKRKVEE
uniref:arylsulfatase J n=1 Tax=Monopterus albus TaxID=43700 RepID=UPI0009B399DF|nr:arylsulfatase J [Monopterus albus]